MKEKYPYYVFCMVSGGLLTKQLRGKKFATEEEVREAINRVYADGRHKEIFNSSQYVILRYSGLYECRITHVINDGKIIDISVK